MDSNMYGAGPDNTQETAQYSSYYDPQIQPQVQRTAGTELEEPVSLGEWLIALFLMWIPCVNIVLMFVWAFSHTEKKSKSNFFKASLIMTGVSIALSILMVILMSVGMLAAI